VIDFTLFASCSKVISLDSDILFFSYPTVLVERIEDEEYIKSTLNRDWRYGYSPSLTELNSSVDFEVLSDINTGLGLIYSTAISFDALEEYLNIPNIDSHPYGGRSEQTLFALSLCKSGFEFLPKEYDVHLGKTPTDSPVRHYVSPVRQLMYGEGIRRLVKQNFLKAESF
jgi:hypothetical protein